MSGAPAQRPAGRYAAVWGALPRRDRRFYAGLLIGCLIGLAAQPVWRALDAQVRVSARFWEETGATVMRVGGTGVPAPGDVDPWGRPLLGAVIGAHLQVTVAYSTGPNGIDEGGQGDDVRVLPDRHPRLIAYWLLPGAAVALTLALAVGWELVRFLRRPRLPLAVEVGGSALAALPIGGAAAGALVVALRRGWLPGGLRAPLEQRLLVPLEASLAAWALTAAFGAILWLRLRREAEQAPSPSSEPLNLPE